MTLIHADGPYAPGWPEGVPMPDDLMICCMGAAVYGPERCTCWEAIFDQPAPERVVPGPVEQRTKCCSDCAYRNGSPERVELEGFPEVPMGAAFWCHDGMRRVIGWRHRLAPDVVVPAGAGDYRPAVDSIGIAYRADGTPASLCAGWRAVTGENAARVHRRLDARGRGLA